MMRMALFTMLGAAFGAIAAGLILESKFASDGSASVPPTLEYRDLGQSPERVARSAGGLADQRLQAYEVAAGIDDATALISAVEITAARSPSLARDNELEALLGRLAEIDPYEGVELASSLRLETRFIALSLNRLAQIDLDAALLELVAIDPPITQRELALSLTRLLGGDSAASERVAAALPPEHRFSFTVDALAMQATWDGVTALRLALDMTEYEQRVALLAIAESIGGARPAEALSLASVISDPTLRAAYSQEVFIAWVRFDPSAVFMRLEQADTSEIPDSSEVFEALAASNAERLLAGIDRFPPDARLNARLAAIRVIAEGDPNLAIRRLENVPPGRDRNRLVETVGESYGRRDPYTAVSWATALSPPSQEALNGVIKGIAAVDNRLAIETVLRELESPTFMDLDIGVALSMTQVFRFMNENSAEIGAVASRLLATGNPTAQARAQAMVTTWVSRDPQVALQWTLAHVGSLDLSDMTTLARQAASFDMAVATRISEQLSGDVGQTWIANVAAGMLQDIGVDAALNYLQQFRGQPAYDQGLETMVRETLQSDPASAARVLSEADPSTFRLQGAVPAVASAWAQRDPESATDWAIARNSDMAVFAAFSSWAQTDSAAARRRLLDLPSGTQRDSAITGILVATAAGVELDSELLASYSTDAARQRGVVRAIRQMASVDRDRSRELMNDHITDAELRRQIERELERSSGAGSILPTFPRIAE